MIRRNTGRPGTAATAARRRGRTPQSRSRPRPEGDLEGLGHPHLAPPGWTIGRPLREFLTEGPLSVPEAVAVSLATLSALAALHRAGRAHGGVSEDSVGVAVDGWVRLAASAARDDHASAERDVRETGRLVCRLLGARVEEDGGVSLSWAEKISPALVTVARSLARGGPRCSADEAWTALREAAGYWGSEPQLVGALAELADRVAGATGVERAVTRVMVGPPLGTESAVPERREDPSRQVLPAVVSELSVPHVSLPRPQLRAPRPGRRFFLVVAAALLVGLVAGAAAGTRALLLRARPAAAAPAAKVEHPAAPAASSGRPSGLYAQTPDAAVSMFFELVREHRLNQAALLWKLKMAAAVDLPSRFGGISGIDLRRDQTVAEDDRLGIATVEVDWVETHTDGSTREYIGEIYTDTGPVLWRWDSWRVQQVAGDGGDGGGG
jgi:hypothetical protein